jgi:hypothetical protein
MVGFSISKEPKESKLWGKTHSEFIGVKSLILSKTQAMWGLFFYTTNHFLQVM